jgi:hypothetical protein
MTFRSRHLRNALYAATLLIAALLVAALQCSAQSAEPPPPASHWFDWDQRDNSKAGILRVCHVSPQIYEQFNETAHKIADAWGATPNSTGPDEYAQWTWQPSGCHLASLKGLLEYWPWPRSDFRMEKAPGASGNARVHITGEALPMRLEINHPAGITSIPVMNPPDKVEIGYIHVSRRAGGYPIYNYDHVLVIEANGRSLFEPVSLGEALQRWIQYAYANEPSLLRHKALLAHLSPEALKQPAYFDTSTVPTGIIVTTPTKNTDPIVRYSQSYFDKNVSPAVPQLLTLDLHFLDLNHETMADRTAHHWYNVNMVYSPDWHKLASMLH